MVDWNGTWISGIGARNSGLGQRRSLCNLQDSRSE